VPIRILRRILKDQVTYWPPVLDASGEPVLDENQNPTYAAPVEILCFWMEKVEEYLSGKGEQRVSRSVVLVNRDVQELGLLYHAPLNRLTQQQKENPRQFLPKIELIQRFDKTPNLKQDDYVRKAYT
jgi:hypothetical protein